MTKKTKGFSLLELIVVVAIIAIITAIIIGGLQGARSKARDTERIAELSQLQLALAGYLNKHGFYPKGGGAGGVGVWSDLNVLDTENFIGSLPADPLGTGNYVYGYCSLADGSTYCLAANLENESSTVDRTEDCSTSCTPGFTAGTYPYRVSK